MGFEFSILTRHGDRDPTDSFSFRLTCLLALILRSSINTRLHQSPPPAAAGDEKTLSPELSLHQLDSTFQIRVPSVA